MINQISIRKKEAPNRHKIHIANNNDPKKTINIWKPRFDLLRRRSCWNLQLRRSRWSQARRRNLSLRIRGLLEVRIWDFAIAIGSWGLNSRSRVRLSFFHLIWRRRKSRALWFWIFDLKEGQLLFQQEREKGGGFWTWNAKLPCCLLLIPPRMAEQWTHYFTQF